MHVLSDIDDMFYLLQCPFRSLRNEFIAYKLEEYDKLPHLRFMPSNRTLFYQVGLLLSEDPMPFMNNEARLISRPNMLTFISPFHITAFEQTGSMKGIVFLFSESFINHSFQNNQFHKDFPFFWSSQNNFFIDNVSTQLFLQLGDKIIHEYQHLGPCSEIIIRDYLHIFMMQAKRVSTSPAFVEDNSAEFRLLQQFYLLVNNSFPILKSVESAAAILHVTPTYLWSAVKKLTNQTPLQIINQRLITEAKSLLLQSTLTISEIGYRLQFKEKSHFTRFFKNITGVTPIDFSRLSKKNLLAR